MNKKVFKDINETIYSKKLDNGLSVFLLPKQEMSKTYAIFSTDYGSIDQTFVPMEESEEVTVPKGIAHFLEHKLFEKEDRDVFADFGKQGASANAYTSFTKTAYLFTATDHIEQNVNTLLDFVQDPYFSDESVEKEKGIIAAEIKMYDDQADWQSFMGMIKAMFHNFPVKYDIAGTVDSIQKITKDDLYTCYHTFYHPENMTFFITGNFDPVHMMQIIEQNQAKKKYTPLEPIKRSYPTEPRDVAMAENKIVMPVTIPKCTVGIKESSHTLTGDKFLERDLLQSMVLDHYFAKGSPFYEELYNDNYIDNSFSYSSTLEKHFGYSMISSNTEQPEAFAKKVKELLFSTNKKELTPEEVEMMKNKRVGLLLRRMNSLEFIANQYIDYHLLGVDFFSVIRKIQSLTVEDVNNFAQQWISEDRLSVCKVVAK